MEISTFILEYQHIKSHGIPEEGFFIRKLSEL